MRIILSLAICASLACQAEPLKQVESVNKDVTVELLTAFEDVKIYRVRDGHDGPTLYIAVQSKHVEVAWDLKKDKETIHMRTQTAIKE